MIITLTMNPAVDLTVTVDKLAVDSVNRAQTCRKDAGGKGINVSKVIAALGGRSLATGFIAGENGRFIEKSLTAAGIENEFIVLEGETRTNVKIIDRVEKTNTDINTAGVNTSAAALKKLAGKLFGMARRDTVVVISGSAPPETPDDFYCQLIAGCKAQGAVTILDADGAQLRCGLKGAPDIIKPNISELEKLCGHKLDGDAAIAAEATGILKKYNIKTAVVSLGSRGALIAGQNRLLKIPAVEVEVRSTVGAGDAMVAAIAYSMEHKYDFEKMACLAVACGTANVTTSGSNPAPQEKVLELLGKIEFINMEV